MLCVAPAWEVYDNIHTAKDALEEFWREEEANQDMADLLNKRVAVYFASGAKGWYNGTVTSVDEVEKCFDIAYDDTSTDTIEDSEWEWKRGEYTKSGKRKVPKRTQKKAKPAPEPQIAVPQLSLPDMTQRFDSMLSEKLGQVPALAPTFADDESVVALRRKFVEAVVGNGGACPLPGYKLAEEYIPAVAGLVHEKAIPPHCDAETQSIVPSLTADSLYCSLGYASQNWFAK